MCMPMLMPLFYNFEKYVVFIVVLWIICNPRISENVLEHTCTIVLKMIALD